MFVLFMLLGALTIANMLIGVICDLMKNMSDEEAEESMRQQMDSTIGQIIGEINEDENTTISKAEFGHMLRSETAMRLLHDRGVDIVGLRDFSDIIFEDESLELSFRDFMEVVLGFRKGEKMMKFQLSISR